MSQSSKQVQPKYNIGGVFLRLISIGGKFLLVMFIAKYMTLEELGIYGLFVVTSNLVMYVLGFEFYGYATRELIKHDASSRSQIVWNQGLFHSVAYLIIMPLIISVFWLNVLPWTLVVWFYLVLVGTHISQELTRILIAVSRPLAAYVVAAGTHGFWVFPVVLLMVIEPNFRTLNFILGTWAIAGLLSSVAGIFYLKKIGLLEFKAVSTDWSWVIKGLKICWIFFIISLCYQVIALSDRYFIQFFLGEASVGVYTFFVSIARVLQDIISTGITAVLFPLLVASYHNADVESWRLHIKQMTRDVTIATVLLFPLFIIGIYILLPLLGKEQFYQELTSYIILLVSSAILNLALIPHYILYARRADLPLLYATLSGAILNVILNCILVPFYGIMGAAIATSISFAFMAMLKLIYSFKYNLYELK
ncbi:lipid II flippase MurJ [Candidatus Marithrix sp. Canyon 246]|uniref:lipid II flippase MurJ n=1 Tax=Candidatus Marithrix sp. Canyon 246 TaxID=1827136 RepID=UPI000849FB1A|nr:polysaccharide biosynthesis C-terminal domain-containing protein [Candidatus Marithrix sp. Canyon 246]